MISRFLTSFAKAKDTDIQPRVRELLLSSRRWRTRCSSPITRASPQMGSRISTHRPPPNFFFLLLDPLSFSFVRQKVTWADSLKDSTCPASLRQTDTFHVSGGDADCLSFYPLYTFPRTHTHVHIYRFLPFSIFRVASRAWRGCNLYSVVFETGTRVSSSQRTPHVYPHAPSHVGVASVYVYACCSDSSCVRALSSRAKTLRSDKRSLI